MIKLKELCRERLQIVYLFSLLKKAKQEWFKAFSCAKLEVATCLLKNLNKIINKSRLQPQSLNQTQSITMKK